MSTHTPPQLPENGFIRTPVTLRFNDIDLFSHVNNTVYLELMDLGKAEYYMRANKGEFTAKSIGFVIVHIDIDFCHPTHAEESVDVITCLVRLTRKTAKFRQWVVNRFTDEIKSFSETILVNINGETQLSEDITDEYKSRLLNVAESLGCDPDSIWEE